MISDILIKQRQAVDVFFDNLDISYVEHVMQKIIEKRQNHNVIYWTGVGKSYNIASHSADMLKSMGFTSFALKPVEALHGDMGAINKGDLIIVYSKSGNTQELVSFMVHLNKLDVEVYGIFCNPKAKLSQYCNKVIVLPCGKELDNDFDLVPTTSIISFILFVNMLVSYYLRSQKIDIFQYGKNHPSGNIGKRIWFTVKDIMYQLEDICIIDPTAKLLDCMLQMTSYRSGYAVVVDDTKIVGILSDGDIRRYLTKNVHDAGYDDSVHKDVNLNIPISLLINEQPTTINHNERIMDIIEAINNNKSLSVGIPVVDDNNKFVGFIDNKLLVKYGSIF